MQQSLEKRVSALEQVSTEGVKVVFIILVDVGEVGMELTHIHDNHGNNWNRRLGETEEVFKNRATSETSRKENQIAMLFGECKGCGV